MAVSVVKAGLITELAEAAVISLAICILFSHAVSFCEAVEPATVSRFKIRKVSASYAVHDITGVPIPLVAFMAVFTSNGTFVVRGFATFKGYLALSVADGLVVVVLVVVSFLILDMAI